MDKEALAAMWNRSAPTFDQVGPRVFADLGRQLNEAEWWSMMWSVGMRRIMEQMDSTTLSLFKVDVYETLQHFRKASVFCLPVRTLFARGNKGLVVDSNR